MLVSFSILVFAAPSFRVSSPEPPSMLVAPEGALATVITSLPSPVFSSFIVAVRVISSLPAVVVSDFRLSLTVILAVLPAVVSTVAS